MDYSKKMNVIVFNDEYSVVLEGYLENIEFDTNSVIFENIKIEIYGNKSYRKIEEIIDKKLFKSLMKNEKSEEIKDLYDKKKILEEEIKELEEKRKEIEEIIERIKG